MKQQMGVALVSVLLVVAIGTVMAVTMIQEQQASIQATRGFLSRTQANQYALGGEELARQILFEDFTQENKTDHLAEVWADPELHFEFEEGEVNLRITDLQGLININNLGERGDFQSIARRRMLDLLAANGGDAAVVDRVQDWIDADTIMRTAGAEDFDYLVFDPPYRAGNGLVAHESEIRLTELPVEQYQLIQQAITALPTENTRLNINTASPVVMQSLSSSLPIEVAESIAQTRDEQEGFETVQEFLQLPQLAGLGISADALGVQSSFFEIRVIARFQDRFSYVTSLVHRDSTSGKMSVLARSFMRNIQPANAGESRNG